jgi:DNA-binding NtrC family response regulator
VEPAAPATVPPPLTIQQALDFIFAELRTGDEPMLPRLEQEFVQRAMAAEQGDLGKVAKRLGLPKIALQKKLK